MKTKTLIVVILTAVIPSLAFGLGFRLTDMDAEATSKGGAFTATADNPSAIFYNPAGITQLPGLQVRDSIYGVYVNDEFTSPSGKKIDTKDKIQTVPHLYITFTPDKSPVSFGLGAYSPYGLGMQWPDDSPFRTLSTRGDISYLTVSPVVAVQFSRWFSVAGGITADFADALLERGLPSVPGVFQSGPGDFYRFKGSGANVGFTFGAMWQPTTQHSFGASYHSATDIRFTGHSTTQFSGNDLKQIDAVNAKISMANQAIEQVKAQVPAAYVPATLASLGLPSSEITPVPTSISQERSTANFHFPQFVMAGYSFRPTPDWNFEFNVDWTDWNSLNTVNLKTPRTNTTSALPFNWKSSCIFELGAERKFSNGIHLATGYIYSQNSVPDSQFNPGIPDSQRHVWSIGVGQKKERIEWDFGYQFAWGPSRNINNGTLADGSYRFISHALTLSFGYNF